MAKGGRTKNKSKRSTIPRGIPQKRSGGGNNSSSSNNNVISPFEYARTTNSSSRVKHHVHNKSVSGSSSAAASGKHQQSALAKSIARRKHLLKSQLETQHKSNEFVDRRIGEAGKQQQRYNGDDDDGGKQRRENAMLKRIVAERVRRSKRAGKFSLEDDNVDGGLTHRVSLCLLVSQVLVESIISYKLV
jgi:nucleolar protein 14